MDKACKFYTRMGSQLVEAKLGCGCAAAGLEFSINDNGELCVETSTLGNVELKINDNGELEASNV